MPVSVAAGFAPQGNKSFKHEYFFVFVIVVNSCSRVKCAAVFLKDLNVQMVLPVCSFATAAESPSLLKKTQTTL